MCKQGAMLARVIPAQLRGSDKKYRKSFFYDDDNNFDEDGCDVSCAVETGFACSGDPSVCISDCGDGVVASDEACDDGENVDGDGCSASCVVEDGYGCSGAPSNCGSPAPSVSSEDSRDSASEGVDEPVDSAPEGAIGPSF